MYVVNMQFSQTMYVVFVDIYYVRCIDFVIYYAHNRDRYNYFLCPNNTKKETIMSYSKSKTEYNIQYAKKNIKRIPLDVQKEKYEEIKSAALAIGETVNGYIKKAIDDRLSNTSNSLNIQQKKSQAAETQTAHQEPPKSESKAPHTSQRKLKKQFKAFTESDAEKIDMARLPKDVKYQMDIADVYGMDILGSLLDKAKMELAESIVAK